VRSKRGASEVAGAPEAGRAARRRSVDEGSRATAAAAVRICSRVKVMRFGARVVSVERLVNTIR
jgi:hypothetical protein